MYQMVNRIRPGTVWWTPWNDMAATAIPSQSGREWEKGRSVIMQPRDSIGVENCISQQVLAYTRALHLQSQIQLPGHFHPAMHLPSLLYGECCACPGFRLRDRNERSGGIERLIECLQRFENRRAGNFEFTIEKRGAMLQCLELADRAAKLLAFFQITDSSA